MIKENKQTAMDAPLKGLNDLTAQLTEEDLTLAAGGIGHDEQTGQMGDDCFNNIHIGDINGFIGSAPQNGDDEYLSPRLPEGKIITATNPDHPA